MSALERLILFTMSVVVAGALLIIPLMWAGYWVAKGVQLAGGLGV
jgi:hypothetical protein